MKNVLSRIDKTAKSLSSIPFWHLSAVLSAGVAHFRKHLRRFRVAAFELTGASTTSSGNRRKTSSCREDEHTPRKGIYSQKLIAPEVLASPPERAYYFRFYLYTIHAVQHCSTERTRFLKRFNDSLLRVLEKPLNAVFCFTFVRW